MSLAKFKKIIPWFLLGILMILLAKFAWMQITQTIQPTLANSIIEFPASSDFINVKNFGAKGDGVTDDTLALQKAINSTNRDYQVVYFPQGTYLVSNTIQIGRLKTIQGAAKNKTIIRLKDRSTAFMQAPKPVLRSMYNNNQTFGVYIRDLTVDTGQGNSKAIGIQYNTHNNGAIDNVMIKSEDLAGTIGLDLSETEFGPGMITNLTVEGFDTGIKTPSAPSNAVFYNISLKQQNIVGLENNQPVSIEGLNSENRVPAIRTTSSPLAHLILIDARLSGLPGMPSDIAAIEADSSYYLRQTETDGNYAAALEEKGELVDGKLIDERWSSFSQIVSPSKQGHLKLKIEQPPRPYLEPATNWLIPDSSQEDDTQAVQNAMNSGAKTIFFPGNVTYKIADSIEVPATVKRIVAHKNSDGNLIVPDFMLDRFGNKPMFRLTGKSRDSLEIESLMLSTWPRQPNGIEVATNRSVYVKYSESIVHGKISTTDNWSGKIYVDEWLGELQLKGKGSAWLRQWNPENNPFTPGQSNSQVTYGINNGSKLWVLGMKTEAPAIHVITENQGQTEILGGFFRDHFSPNEYAPTVPYFITKDSSLSASYLQYAWASGQARRLQALEIHNAQKQELMTPPELFTMELYNSTTNKSKK
jgi:hypothetical protein